MANETPLLFVAVGDNAARPFGMHARDRACRLAANAGFECADAPALPDTPHPALEKLRDIDPDDLKPREALDLLYELRTLVRSHDVDGHA